MAQPDRQAARLTTPTWRDSRLLIGVVLVLASVVAGARLITSFDQRKPVYAAAVALVPGEPVHAEDLTRVEVTLGSAAERYLAADRTFALDAVALRDVRPGELVLSSAIGGRDQAGLKPVMLPVDHDSARVLVVGSRVDVWVNARRGVAGSAGYGVPVRILSDAAVSRVPEVSANRLANGRTVGVQVMVPTDQVERLIAAVDQEARITLVPVVGSPQA